MYVMLCFVILANSFLCFARYQLSCDDSHEQVIASALFLLPCCCHLSLVSLMHIGTSLSLLTRQEFTVALLFIYTLNCGVYSFDVQQGPSSDEAVMSTEAYYGKRTSSSSLSLSLSLPLATSL